MNEEDWLPNELAWTTANKQSLGDCHQSGPGHKIVNSRRERFSLRFTALCDFKRIIRQILWASTHKDLRKSCKNLLLRWTRRFCWRWWMSRLSSPRPPESHVNVRIRRKTKSKSPIVNLISFRFNYGSSKFTACVWLSTLAKRARSHQQDERPGEIENVWTLFRVRQSFVSFIKFYWSTWGLIDQLNVIHWPFCSSCEEPKTWMTRPGAMSKRLSWTPPKPSMRTI